MSLLVGVTVHLTTIGSGGLAPIAGAAVLAAFLGVPLARLEWQRDGVGTPWMTASTDLWTLLLVASLVAEQMADRSPTAVIAMACAWGFAIVVGRYDILRWVAVVAALGVTASAAWLALTKAPPWTLLEPYWGSWQQWGPRSVVLGILLPSAATRSWTQLRPTPGGSRLPWSVVGLGLLFAVAIAVTRGALWEASAGQVVSSLLLTVGVGLATLAAAASLSRRGRPWLMALGGLGATLWFMGPAHDALPLWWSTLLPLGLGIDLLQTARGAQGFGRWTVGMAVAALVLATIVAWPGLPHEPLAAGSMAAIVVLTVWISGLRTIWSRGEATP